jgi:hypothetical protein
VAGGFRFSGLRRLFLDYAINCYWRRCRKIGAVAEVVVVLNIVGNVNVIVVHMTALVAYIFAYTVEIVAVVAVQTVAADEKIVAELFDVLGSPYSFVVIFYFRSMDRYLIFEVPQQICTPLIYHY